MHYSLSAGTQSDEIRGDTHGNAKVGSTVTKFRPREHSLKVESGEKARTETRAPRIITQESSEKNDVLDSENDCSSIRDPTQITNTGRLARPVIFLSINICCMHIIFLRKMFDATCGTPSRVLYVLKRRGYLYQFDLKCIFFSCPKLFDSVCEIFF